MSWSDPNEGRPRDRRWANDTGYLTFEKFVVGLFWCMNVTIRFCVNWDIVDVLIYV